MLELGPTPQALVDGAPVAVSMDDADLQSYRTLLADSDDLSGHGHHPTLFALAR